MSWEMRILLGAVLLGLVHIAVSSFTFRAQVGNRYAVGPRDEDIRPKGIAGRLARAQSNFLETFPLFAACVLTVEVTGASSSWSVVGSALYLAGRIVYLPVYAAGIPWVRSLTWNVATLGLALVGLAVVA